MTTLTNVSRRPVGRPSRRNRAWRIGGWGIRVALASQFVGGGLAKLTAAGQMVAMFEDMGAGTGLRILVGACEVLGGLGVLLPRTARPAAFGLAALMVGAVGTNVFLLGASPVIATVLLALALAAFVHAGREVTR